MTDSIGKGIPNRRFWELWKSGEYEEALRQPAEPLPAEPAGSALQSLLFGGRGEWQSTLAAFSLSAGEFLYDYARLNPAALQGIDFARAEDLSSLFAFSTFAQQVDISENAGSLAQLQGYVAERMVAAELQAKGHEVEFPSVSNQEGYDLLVDGSPFQVKNLADASGVREHLARYPDIPVYVNEELAGSFLGNPMVYATGVRHDEVLQAVRETLEAGADLADFQIPQITLAVSAFKHAKRLIFDEATLGQAITGVLSDTASRAVLGTIGKITGTSLGLLLFGPAGGLVGAATGAVAGAGQGGHLAARLKRMANRGKAEQLAQALDRLAACIKREASDKLARRDRQKEELDHRLGETPAGAALKAEFGRRSGKHADYIRHRCLEIDGLVRSFRSGRLAPQALMPELLRRLAQTGIHPSRYQHELADVTGSLNAYRAGL